MCRAVRRASRSARWSTPTTPASRAISSRLSSPTTVAAGQAAGWVDFSFSGTPGLGSGSYWLGYWYSTRSALEYYTQVSGGGRYKAVTYSSSSNPVANYAGGTSQNVSFSLYVTLGSAASAPTNTTLPAISGGASATQGVQLTADNGVWDGSPTGYTQKWQQCNSGGTGCVDISGATGPTYTPLAGDVGKTLRVVVTATNASGSTPASSNPTAVVQAAAAAPTNTTLPAITGGASATQGVQLTADNGVWDGSPTGYTQKWQQCNSGGTGCVDISGATGPTYTPLAGDVGKTLRVVVTATNASGSTPASSNATAVVQAAAAAPTNTTLPAITGGASATQGVQLTADNGVWDGSPTGYTQKWQQCNSGGTGCVDISGATGPTYTPLAGDVGKTLRVVVTATNASGSTPASSNPTAVVQAAAAAPTNTTLPAITGGASATQGVQLTADNGVWDGSPTGYTQKWQQCNSGGTGCVDISGATGPTYTPLAGDVGKTLRVVVTATNASGSTPASSNATAVVQAAAAAPTNTTLPAISGGSGGGGAPVVGDTLTTTNGSWDGTPAPTAGDFAYQWQRCDSSGNSCADITSETNQTYTLVTGDEGSTYRVVVTATTSSGSGNATSAVTAVATAP